MHLGSLLTKQVQFPKSLQMFGFIIAHRREAKVGNTKDNIFVCLRLLPKYIMHMDIF